MKFCILYSSKFSWAKKFCEIDFCDKNFVIGRGEPTPTVDHSKFLGEKFLWLDDWSRNWRKYYATKIWSYTVLSIKGITIDHWPGSNKLMHTGKHTTVHGHILNPGSPVRCWTGTVDRRVVGWEIHQVVMKPAWLAVTSEGIVSRKISLFSVPLSTIRKKYNTSSRRLPTQSDKLDIFLA